MFNLLAIRMKCANLRLNKLIEKFGLMNKKVLKQSQKLDKLIIKYYCLAKPQYIGGALNDNGRI